MRVILKEGLFIEIDNREKLFKKLYVDVDVKLVMEVMLKLFFDK